jgi:dTDP-4-dehydrorhamnose reductase
MKIVILGTGFLGITLYESLKNIYEIITVDKNPRFHYIYKLDALDKVKLKDFLYYHQPDVIINTIALSSYYLCELHKDLCMKINYQLANEISELSNDINAKLIFISSSYVFNGSKGYYSETDTPDSQTAYAKAKILAEQSALKYPNTIVLRIEPMFGYDTSCNRIRIGTNTFENNMKIAFTDLIRSPVLINDIPVVLNNLINNNHSGIFNIASNLQLNWYQCIQSLASLENANDKLEIVTKEQWILEPPQNTSLNIDKLLRINSVVTSFSDSLKILKSSLLVNQPKIL